MDFLLTDKGDLLLEEAYKKTQPLLLDFFINANSSSFCLRFDFEDRLIPVKHSGLLMNFDIKQYEKTYRAIVIDDSDMIKQMCYNAIRTQKNSLSHAINYGSYFYKYKNQKITNELLKQLENIALEAISHFAPEAKITASKVPTENGSAVINFDIEIYRHSFTLDYIF